MSQYENYGTSVFKRTDTQQWMSLLQDYGLAGATVEDKRNQIKLCCIRPEHKDSTPSAIISPQYGNYFCWSCAKKERITDPVEVVSLITKKSHQESVLIFEEYFDILLERKTFTDAILASKEDDEILNGIVDLSSQVLRSAWKAADAGTPDHSYNPAITYLKRIGVTFQDINTKFKIGVVPRLDSIAAEMPNLLQTRSNNFWDDVDNQEKFKNIYMEYLGVEITESRTGALLLPFYLYPTVVGRIQVRTDFLASVVVPSKYRFHFVSPSKDASAQTKRLASRAVGYFGLDYAAKLLKGETKLLVTEGVSDAISAYKAQQDAIGLISMPAVAIAGAGTDPVSFNQISAIGVEELWVCQDAPEHQGDSVAKVYAATAKDVDLRILKWPDSLTKNRPVGLKDLKEILQQEGPETLSSLILDKNNYHSLHEFLYHHIQEQVAKEQAGPEKTRKIIEEVCANTASPQVVKQLLVLIEQELPGVELSELKQQNALNVNADTVEGFLARIEKAIKTLYTFLYRKYDKESNSIFIVYRSNRNTTVVIEEKVNSSWAGATAGTMISNDFGSLIEWAQSLNAPKSIMYMQKGKTYAMRTPRGLLQEIKSCVEMALSHICVSVPLMHDPLEKLGNGVHSITLEDEERILVVNGKHRYIGRFLDGENHSMNPRIEWEEYLPDMTTNSASFGEWTPNICSLKDLEEGNKIGIKELWSDIEKVIKTGWAFKDQVADTTWLTSLALYSAFYDFIPMTMLTSITADARSGKTKLAKNFFGAHMDVEDEVMPHVPFFVYMDFPNTSEAGIRLKFAGNGGTLRRGLVLDEFEWSNRNPKSQATMSSILDTCRSMLDGDAIVNKGTKGGGSREFNLRFPLITAGISEYKDDTGATESRIYRIEMKHAKDRESPAHMVMRHFPTMDGKSITRNLTLGMFRWARRVRQYAKKIYTSYQRDEYIKRLMHVTSNDRSASIICVVGGVMMAAGFSEDEIETRLADMLDKVCSNLDLRTEKIGDQVWQRLLSEKNAMPSELLETVDFTGISNNEREMISLYDALTDRRLTEHLGSRKFFPFITYLHDSDEDKHYYLFDRHYLKTFLDKENISWVQFKTQMDRAFGGLEDELLRTTARRITRNSKYSKLDKKLCMIPVPRNIIDSWSDTEQEEGQEDNGGTDE